MGAWDAELQRVNRVYLSSGIFPPWERVWHEGVDVTDQPPETWTWPFTKYYSEGWRPIRDLEGNRW